MKWMDKKKSFHERLIAFAVVEGIFFSGSFCAIFWLKKRGLMPGLTFSNQLISRDEGLHTDFACLLYKTLNNKLKEERINEIIIEAVEIEKKFISEALPSDLVGINSKLMTLYIEFIADRLIVDLGGRKVFHSKNPFEWMEMISMQVKTNVNDARVGGYRKSRVMWPKNEKEFKTDLDF